MFSERWERYWQLLRLVGNVLSRARKGRLGDGRGGGCKLLRVVVVGFWLSMWSRKGGWIGEVRRGRFCKCSKMGWRGVIECVVASFYLCESLVEAREGVEVETQ